MKVYELTLKVYLLTNINKENTLEKIAELIDGVLASNSKYGEFHNSNDYKYYTFNSLYRLEEDGIYKEGNIYSVKIRTIDQKLFSYLKNNLADTYTKHIKGLTIESKILTKRLIKKIYSITPIIIKNDDGYWSSSLSIEDYERRIRENLIKKYNKYFDAKIDEDFELFYRLDFNNHKPIACSYKNIKLLGDKLDLEIAENETAQDLAYFSLGVGIGEMTSRGYGFVNHKFY